jgi:hypothetical protein
MQIPDKVIIDDAGGPDVLVGGTIEATLNSTLGLVGRASEHFREQSFHAQCSTLRCVAPVEKSICIVQSQLAWCCAGPADAIAGSRGY